MALNDYTCSALIGGTTGALDKIDGADLYVGDRAKVLTSSGVYWYILEDRPAESENSPYLITPDANAGDNRWVITYPQYMAKLVGAGQVMQDTELKNYCETVTSPTSSSGTLALDLSASNVFTVLLTENVTTLSITNPPASGKGGFFTLILTPGTYSVTWPASVLWPGGVEPTLGSINLLTFITVDAGTTWYGMLAGVDFS